MDADCWPPTFSNFNEFATRGDQPVVKGKAVKEAGDIFRARSEGGAHKKISSTSGPHNEIRIRSFQDLQDGLDSDDDIFDVGDELCPHRQTQDDCIVATHSPLRSATGRCGHSGRATYNFRVGLLIAAEVSHQASSERAANRAAPPETPERK